MKRYRRYILLALVMLLGLPQIDAATQAAARKTKDSSKAPSKTKKKRRLSARAEARARARAEAKARKEEEERLEQERRARLYTMLGSSPSPAQRPLPSAEPILLRFHRSDSSLLPSDIHYLYHRTPSFKSQAWAVVQEPYIDSLIMSKRFVEALDLTWESLRLSPVHLGLLRRSCTLANHLGREELLNRQIWKLAELLSCISRSGNGKNAETAYLVLSREDALFFETYWLDTPQEQIQDIRTEPDPSGSQSIEVITSLCPKTGKSIERYYRLSLKEQNKKIIYNEYPMDHNSTIARGGGDGTAPGCPNGNEPGGQSPTR